MQKKISIILLCSVAIVVAGACTVNQLLADEKPRPQRFRTIPTLKGIEIIDLVNRTTLKVRYERNQDGCVTGVEFYNDPANCAFGDKKNEKCLDMIKDKPAQARWRPAIAPKKPPVIWGEKLVGVGSTRGEIDVCGDWRFTVAGSPGWDCTYSSSGDRQFCSCIGFYVGAPQYPQFEPPGYCCDLSGKCFPTP
jgi:hypothetical protein